MNRCFVTCVIAVIGLVCTHAHGDVAAMPADPPINSAAMQALSMTPFSAEFAKIDTEVDKLVQNSKDKATVSMVRNWLIANDQSTAATNPYQTAYTAELNKAFVAAISDPKTSFTAKINFGIVIASLSGPKTELADATIRLLGDSNPAVVYWGAKAAVAIMPLALQNAAFNNVAAGGLRDKLFDAINKAVISPNNGKLGDAIAESGYTAINPRLWSAGGAAIAPNAPAFSALADANLKLQKARIALYVTPGVPPFPKGDTFPSYLLFAKANWPALNAAQQLQAVQQTSDLISLAGQRASSLAGGSSSLSQELVEAIQEEGKWIATLGTNLNDANIVTVGLQVNKVSIAMLPSQIRDTCNLVYGALQQNPAFSNITQPQTVGGAPPAGAPATGSVPTPNSGTVPRSASDNSNGTSPTSEAR